jgi:hypothetical protein
MLLAEVMVIVIKASGLALDTPLKTRRDPRRLGWEERSRVPLTAVPPRPYRRRTQARTQLEELGIPLFGVDIRWLETFEAAVTGRSPPDGGAGLPDARCLRPGGFAGRTCLGARRL